MTTVIRHAYKGTRPFVASEVSQTQEHVLVLVSGLPCSLHPGPLLMNYCLACAHDSCVSGFVAQTYVKQGSVDNGSCEQQPPTNNVCPEICQSNTKTVCCLEGGKQLMSYSLVRSRPFIIILQPDTRIVNGLAIRRIV